MKKRDTLEKYYGVRLPKDLAKIIDARAEDLTVGGSTIIRQIVKNALKPKKQKVVHDDTMHPNEKAG